MEGTLKWLLVKLDYWYYSEVNVEHNDEDGSIHVDEIGHENGHPKEPVTREDINIDTMINEPAGDTFHWFTSEATTVNHDQGRIQDTSQSSVEGTTRSPLGDLSPPTTTSFPFESRNNDPFHADDDDLDDFLSHMDF